MSVVLLAAVKTHLNVTSVANDAELQTTINAAEAVLARHVGPLSATATTSRVPGGRFALTLPVCPVISLTSVTPVGGTALNLADITLNGSAGVVIYTFGGTFGSTAYDVAYSAGRTTLPADLDLAVMELTRHLWEPQRNPGRFPGSTISEGPVATMGAGYLMPHRVRELIAPHMQFGFS